MNLDEITITDNFMFASVMQNEEICKGFIERMLEIKVEKIIYLEREKDLRVDPYSKGIRLDVQVKDTGRMFCLEMQCVERSDLELRARYYQSLQDISFLDKGNSYRMLPESYILFICMFDLFKKGEPVYDFETVCKRNSEIKLNDKIHKIFYNVNAWSKETNKARRLLLKYFSERKSEDLFTDSIERQVVHTKNLREWRTHYMTIEQEIKERAEYAAEIASKIAAEKTAKETSERVNAETARKLLSFGDSVEKVCAVTGLSLVEVEKIKSEM